MIEEAATRLQRSPSGQTPTLNAPLHQYNDDDYVSFLTTASRINVSLVRNIPLLTNKGYGSENGAVKEELTLDQAIQSPNKQGSTIQKQRNIMEASGNNTGRAPTESVGAAAYPLSKYKAPLLVRSNDEFAAKPENGQATALGKILVDEHVTRGFNCDDTSWANEHDALLRTNTKASKSARQNAQLNATTNGWLSTKQFKQVNPNGRGSRSKTAAKKALTESTGTSYPIQGSGRVASQKVVTYNKSSSTIEKNVLQYYPRDRLRQSSSESRLSLELEDSPKHKPHNRIAQNESRNQETLIGDLPNDCCDDTVPFLGTSASTLKAQKLNEMSIPVSIIAVEDSWPQADSNQIRVLADADKSFGTKLRGMIMAASISTSRADCAAEALPVEDTRRLVRNANSAEKQRSNICSLRALPPVNSTSKVEAEKGSTRISPTGYLQELENQDFDRDVAISEGIAREGPRSERKPPSKRSKATYGRIRSRAGCETVGSDERYRTNSTQVLGLHGATPQKLHQIQGNSLDLEESVTVAISDYTPEPDKNVFMAKAVSREVQSNSVSERNRNHSSRDSSPAQMIAKNITKIELNSNHQIQHVMLGGGDGRSLSRASKTIATDHEQKLKTLTRADPPPVRTSGKTRIIHFSSLGPQNQGSPLGPKSTNRPHAVLPLGADNSVRREPKNEQPPVAQLLVHDDFTETAHSVSDTTPSYSDRNQLNVLGESDCRLSCNREAPDQALAASTAPAVPVAVVNGRESPVCKSDSQAPKHEILRKLQPASMLHSRNDSGDEHRDLQRQQSLDLIDLERSVFATSTETTSKTFSEIERSNIAESSPLSLNPSRIDEVISLVEKFEYGGPKETDRADEAEQSVPITPDSPGRKLATQQNCIYNKKEAGPVVVRSMPSAEVLRTERPPILTPDAHVKNIFPTRSLKTPSDASKSSDSIHGSEAFQDTTQHLEPSCEEVEGLRAEGYKSSIPPIVPFQASQSEPTGRSPPVSVGKNKNQTTCRQVLANESSRVIRIVRLKQQPSFTGDISPLESQANYPQPFLRQLYAEKPPLADNAIDSDADQSPNANLSHTYLGHTTLVGRNRVAGSFARKSSSEALMPSASPGSLSLTSVKDSRHISRGMGHTDDFGSMLQQSMIGLAQVSKWLDSLYIVPSP